MATTINGWFRETPESLALLEQERARVTAMEEDAERQAAMNPRPGWTVFEWRDRSLDLDLIKQTVVALQHEDGTVHVAVGNVVSTASVLMDRAAARDLRDWLNGIDLEDPGE